MITKFHRGIEVPIPPPLTRVSALQASLGQCEPYERAQPAWCVRVGMNQATRARLTADYAGNHAMFLALAEVRFAVGAVEHILQVDAFPGFTLPIVADRISIDIVTLNSGVALPPLPLQVQLSRGMCESTAFRTFDSVYSTMWAPIGAIPPFATKFGINTPASGADLGIDATITFRVNSGGQVVQTYDYDAIQELFSGALFPIPAGASHFEYENWSSTQLRMVFHYSELG